MAFTPFPSLLSISSPLAVEGEDDLHSNGSRGACRVGQCGVTDGFLLVPSAPPLGASERNIGPFSFLIGCALLSEERQPLLSHIYIYYYCLFSHP